MREEWEMKRFGDICKYDKQQDHFVDLPYVGLEDIESDTTKFLGTLSPTTVKSKTFRFDTSHVLYGRLRPYLNKVLVPNFAGHCSTEIFPVLPSDELDRNFLKYWFISDSTVRNIDSTSTGARMPRANMKEVKDFKIPIPPLHEQKRIVAMLDEAFEAIDQAKANIERNIENAEELFQSKLNEIFSQRGEGWEETTLGDMCSVLNGYAFKSKEAIDSSDTQLLRMGNLYQNRLDLERRPVFYPDSYAEEYEKFVLNEGDLIMSLTGTVDKRDYGYTVELPETDVALLLNQRIMKIIIDKPNLINKSFLKGYLLSPFFLDKLYETASGTRQANLSSRKIMKLPFYYPSDIETQKNIVDVIQSLKEVTNSIVLNNKKRRSNIEELKKSILQKAFSGELTANEHVAA